MYAARRLTLAATTMQLDLPDQACIAVAAILASALLVQTVRRIRGDS